MNKPLHAGYAIRAYSEDEVVELQLYLFSIGYTWAMGRTAILETHMGKQGVAICLSDHRMAYTHFSEAPKEYDEVSYSAIKFLTTIKDTKEAFNE
jgi:hypothetical protein